MEDCAGQGCLEQLPLAIYHPNIGTVLLNDEGDNQSKIWDPTEPLISTKNVTERGLVLVEEGPEERSLAKKLKGDNTKESQEFDKSQIPKNQMVVHGIMGPYLMDKDKWPQLILPEISDHPMGESEVQTECLTQADQSQGGLMLSCLSQS